MTSSPLTCSPLLIRTDANTSIGTGHVMRCLALAQAWQDLGGCCIFAMAQTTTAISARVVAEKCEIVSIRTDPGSEDDANRLAKLAHETGSERLVVDGYQFGALYQELLRRARLQTLFIDDYGHSQHYSADFVLNQNLSAKQQLYANREPHTQLLLGPRYALLRREFQPWRSWTRAIPDQGRKVLLCMGGSDPGNVTAALMPALNMSNVEITVVVGGSNPHIRSLEVEARRSHDVFRLLKDVTDMPTLMAWADVAVSAAGSICWELCAMGLPAILVVTASNQKEVAAILAAEGIALRADADPAGLASAVASLVPKVLHSHQLRQQLAAKGHELVDMEGAARVASMFRGLPAANG